MGRGPMTPQEIETAVRKIAERYSETLGVEIWDVEFKKDSGSWLLLITIDREEGITIDDCEAMSNAVEPELDAADFIAESYRLSVSSVGADRPLRCEADYIRYTGRAVDVKLSRGAQLPEGVQSRRFSGILTGYDGGIITVSTGGRKAVSASFPAEAAEDIRLAITFD